MWSPLRARKIGSDGCLEPFVPFETLGDLNKLNCDRDSQGDVYFADMSLCAVRPRCLENIDSGLLPQKWLGKKSIHYTTGVALTLIMIGNFLRWSFG